MNIPSYVLVEAIGSFCLWDDEVFVTDKSGTELFNTEAYFCIKKGFEFSFSGGMFWGMGVLKHKDYDAGVFYINERPCNVEKRKRWVYVCLEEPAGYDYGVNCKISDIKCTSKDIVELLLG